ncbi:MAG TPA: alpha/beta hydrolase [Actinomycetota bacterium]|nr:alpha/beta hydrolase [Actinomycetota bacterium]
MPALLLHGVPDTDQLWGPVLEHLKREDVLAPRMPGFGAALPPGFSATKEDYLDWLAREVEQLGEPADLVGHDWGAILVQRLVALRPELVRSWVAGAGTVSPSGKWHDMAKMWQTPGEGEAAMEAWASMTPEQIAELLAAVGVPEEHALASARMIDPVMGDAILKLYRSAVNLFQEWSSGLESSTVPGMLVTGAGDPFIKADLAGKEAERLGVRLVVVEEGGHWFPLERPGEYADTLEDFWSTASSA